MIPLVWERFPPQPGEQEIRLRPNVRPMSDDVIGDVGRVLWILLGTVGIVLVMACANVANLFLVRAEGRRREFAVRAALGASRGRLARGLLVECVTLGLAGGVLGLVLARAGIGLLVWLAPSGLPRVEEIGLHPVVLLFTVTIAIVAGLLFGLLAILKLGAPTVTALEKAADRRPRVQNATARATRSSWHRSRWRSCSWSSRLSWFARSSPCVRSIRASLVPNRSRPCASRSPRRLSAISSRPSRTHEQIAERLRQLPGVQSVGLASSITMDGIFFNGSILVEQFPETGGRDRQFRRHKFVAPGYFETMGNPVLMGRTITWRDIYQDALVAVVSAKLARDYWENTAEAIGKRIRVSPEPALARDYRDCRKRAR